MLDPTRKWRPIRWNRIASGAVQDRMDLSRPFVGAEAIAAGAISRARLRGRGFRALFHGIYVRADVPPTLALRSEAAYRKSVV